MATEDDADLTVPQGEGPEPVPAKRPIPESLGDTGATFVRGAEEGSDATLLEGSGGKGARDKELRPAPAKPREEGQKKRVFAGRFEVEDVLGEGGMGRVYVVRDRQIEGRRIALKVLRPRFSKNERFRELFFKEIHAAQSFVSEHVTQVRDTGQMEDGTLFLTMDFVEGEPLDKVLERETSLTARHALEITRQVLLGLASGHEQGFVHCDVKPANVILAAKIPKTEENPFGVGVRVLDFGISNIAAEMEEGTIVGTPRYMSPEQVQGQRLDARSDLFAAGVLLYEVLSGTRPFEGTTVKEVQTAVLETDITPLIRDLEHLPDPIRKILDKALKKDRKKRFQSASEFIEAIEKSKSYKEPSGVPGWVAPMLGLFVVASIAEGAMLWRQREQMDDLLGEKAEWAGAGGVQIQKAVEEAKAAQGSAYEIKINGLNDTIAGLESDRDGLAKQLMELEVADTVDSGKLDSLTRDWEDAERRYKEELAARQGLEEQVAELETWRRRMEAQMAPESQAASLFDSVMERIEKGYEASALSYLEVQNSAGDPKIKADQGGELVSELVRAAAFVKDAAPLAELTEPGSDPERRAKALAALADSRSHFEAVVAREGAFSLEAKPWIDTKVADNSEPDRLGRVATLRARIAAQLAELEVHESTIAGEVERMRAAELTSILAEPVTASPEPLIAYLRSYGAEDLAERLDALGVWAESRYAPSGRLDSGALIESEFMAAFEGWLFQDGGGAQVDYEGVLTLKWLAAARVWYSGEPLQRDHVELVSPLPVLTSQSPYSDWRAELSLAHMLSTPGGYPLVLGDAVLKTVWKGDTQWHREVIAAGENGGFVVSRRVVTADGRLASHVEELVVERRDDTLRFDKELILDLRASGDSVAVAAWPHKLVEGLPAEPWTSSLDDQDYRKSLERQIPCLVYRKAGREYWYSPTHGLVRQTREQDFERELVYSDAVR